MSHGEEGFLTTKEGDKVKKTTKSDINATKKETRSFLYSTRF